MPNYKKPVFIIGMPRSGTTLMQGILCNSKKYFPMPETHFFARATYSLPEKNLSKKNRKRIRRKLVKKTIIKKDLKFADDLNTQKDIFEYLVDQFNPDDASTFLEKTPRHVFFYSKIREYYPDAKFICLIREPKNVISSQLSNSRKQNKSVIRLSFLYNKIAAVILKIKEHNDVLLIKYESVTGQTEQTIRYTCKFLDISYDTKLVENVAAPSGIVLPHEFWKYKNIYQETIQRNNADKWRKTLSDNQANTINFITNSNARKFGYTSSYKRLKVLNGFQQDMKKLLCKSELKKIVSIIHG
jgi:hypothetical protein